jgi:hypothetical protein
MKPRVVPLPVFQIPLIPQPLLMIAQDPDLEPTEEDLVPALDLNLEGVAVFTSMDTFVPTFSFVAGESAFGSEIASFTGTA